MSDRRRFTLLTCLALAACSGKTTDLGRLSTDRPTADAGQPSGSPARDAAPMAPDGYACSPATCPRPALTGGPEPCCTDAGRCGVQDYPTTGCHEFEPKGNLDGACNRMAVYHGAFSPSAVEVVGCCLSSGICGGFVANIGCIDTTGLPLNQPLRCVPHCSDGVLDGDEQAVDCGGSCAICSGTAGASAADAALP